MASLDRSLWTPRTLSALRIVAALLFMQHGMQKIFHFPPGGHSLGPFVLLSLHGIAGVLEFGGGMLLLIGLFTRLTAFLLSGEMAVGYFLVHVPLGLKLPWGIFPVVNQGDLAILFCFVFLYLSFARPGPWSLDALRTRNRDIPQSAPYINNHEA